MHCGSCDCRLAGDDRRYSPQPLAPQPLPHSLTAVLVSLPCTFVTVLEVCSMGSGYCILSTL